MQDSGLILNTQILVNQIKDIILLLLDREQNKVNTLSRDNIRKTLIKKKLDAKD